MTAWSRRQALKTVAAGLLAAGLATAAQAGEGQRPVAVVELFTSQGCSSCPPADALLGTLAQRDGVVALTFNVDYWDYLGWKDTLASPLFTKRQRDYAEHRGDGQVYTPQMVINGHEHLVGSREMEIREAIATELARAPESFVPVSMEHRGKELIVHVGAAPDGTAVPDATVWVATVVPQTRVAIARGENGGRELTYYNVVRQIVPAGMWSGAPVTVTLPADELVDEAATECVALLQVDGGGAILGSSPVSDLRGGK